MVIAAHSWVIGSSSGSGKPFTQTTKPPAIRTGLHNWVKENPQKVADRAKWGSQWWLIWELCLLVIPDWSVTGQPDPLWEIWMWNEKVTWAGKSSIGKNRKGRLGSRQRSWASVIHSFTKQIFTEPKQWVTYQAMCEDNYGKCH